MNKRPYNQTWMTIVYDKSLKIVDIINPQHCMLLQLNEDEILGKGVDNLKKVTDGSNKDAAATIIKNVRKAYKENHNVYFEYTTTHKDGTVTYAVCYAEKGSDDLLYVNVIKIDEENIFEAREGFTNYVFDVTMNNISVGVGMRHIAENGEKKYILFNDVAKEFFECNDVLQSQHWNQKDDDAADEKTMQLHDPLKIEKVIRDKRGNIGRWLVLTKKKISSKANGYYIITTMIDITKRRQNEILLEQQFSLLDSMYKNIPVGIIIYDKNGYLVSLNQMCQDIFGINDKEKVLGLNIFDEPNTPQRIKEKLKNGEDVQYEVEYDFELSNNTYFTTSVRERKLLSLKESIIYNKDGKVDGYLQICEDISEKRIKEKLLIETGLKFSTIFNSMSSGIEIYDRNCVLIDCNDADLKIFGIAYKEDLIGQGVTFYNNPNLSPKLIEDLVNGKDVRFNLWYDFDTVRHDKYYRTSRQGKVYLEAKGSPMFTDSHELIGYVFEVNDVTLVKEQEIQLADSHKNLVLALDAGHVSTWKYDIKNRHFTSILGNSLAGDGLSYEEIDVILHPDDRRIMQKLFDALISGEQENGVFTLRYYDDEYGDYKYYESEMNVYKDIDGNVECIIGTQRDVTDRCLKQLELDNARKSLDLVMEASNMLAWDYDLFTKKYRILYGKRLLEKHSGITEDRANLHPEDVGKYNVLIKRLIAGEIEQDAVEMRIKDHEDDTYYTFEHTISSITNTEGKIVGLIGSMYDITERRKKRDELERSREDLNLALEAGDVAAWTYDVDKQMFYTLQGNALAGAGVSMQQNQLMIHPDDITMQNELFASIISGEKRRAEAVFRYKATNPAGAYRYYESRMLGKKKNGRVTIITGTQKDITDSYTRQQELEEQHKKTNLINGICNIVQWDYNPYTHILISHSSNALFPNQNINLDTDLDKFLLYVHPEDREKAIEFLNTTNDKKPDTVHFEMRVFVLQTIEYKHLVYDGIAIKDKDGNIVKYSGIHRDVSEWLDINERLTEQNNTNSLILNNINSGLVYLDTDCRIKWSNLDAFPDMISKMGINEYATGHYCNCLIDGKCDRRQECMIKIAINTKETQNKEYSFSEELTVDVASIPVFGNDGQIAGALFKMNDITERKKLDNELNYTKEEALRSNQILNEIIDKMPCALYIKDYNDGLRFVKANKLFCDYAGKDGQDVIGKTDHDLFEKANADLHVVNDRYVVESGELSVYEDKITTLAGTRYWHIIKSPLKLASGEIYTVGIGMDVTALRKALEELEKTRDEALLSNQILNEIINRVPGAMYIKDVADDLRYIRANEAFCNVTNKSQEEIIGSTDFGVFNKEVAEMYRQHDFKLINGEKTVSYESTPIINGVQEYLHVTKSIIRPANSKALILGIAMNTTYMHKINEELLAAKEKAEESDKLKSAFLANMSHEIRTPLNAIVGFSGLLAEAEDASERAEYIKIIDYNNELLLRLISDVLDLSKIESGLIELKYETFDIVSTFEEVFASFKPKIINSKVDFLGDNPYSRCIVTLDKNRLIQVGTNFITNAIKYTSLGHIKMGYIYENGGIKIYVEDTGIGIAKDKHHKVFERFEKLDDFAQGTGLGLSICKAIVDVQKGEIGFESEEGKGSRFWAWFPTVAEISDKQVLPTTDQNTIIEQNSGCGKSIQKKNLNILVAEDNDSNYMLVEAILKQYTLTRACNGVEAVKMAKPNKYDAILMDMRMPVMSGLEATRRIREFDKDTLIVAVTANAFDWDRKEAIAAGCNVFITKPLKKEELDEILKKAVN